jgi:CBS domain-containing protein
MIDDAASVSTICKSWQRPRQLQYAKEYFMNTNANLTVRDLMQLRVHAVQPQMTLEELERQFIDKSVSGFPVVENENLVGVVSRSDIVRQLAVERNLAETTSDFYWDRAGFHEERAETIEQVASRLGQRIEDLRVEDLMSRHLVVVAADDSIEIAAQKLLDHHIHRMPVVEQGRLVGLVSTLDFVRLFADKRVRIT